MGKKSTIRFFTTVAAAAFLSFAAPAFAQDKPGFNEGMYAFNVGDAPTAVRVFRSLAEEGDERAQYYLGTLMDAGQGTPRDIVGANSWFLRSARAGYLPAITYMGYAAYTGRGMIRSERDAFKWYAKAARMGDAVAQNNLGAMLRDGIGTDDKNPALAAQWFLQSATQNNARAQFNLGTAYRFGQGVKTNYAEAHRWYKISADQGDMYAESAIGSMYANGQGVKKDMQAAISWYKRAAQKGHLASQLALARLYESDDPAIKNDFEALGWYLQAAEQGSTTAQYRLGYLYETGTGTQKNMQEASKWYTKAVSNDSVAAIGALCRLTGEAATPNDKGAKELFMSGADAGDPYCQLQLGHAYEKGLLGVEKNPVLAYQWLALAAGGLPDGENKANAVVSRIEIANTLNEAQLSEARQRVNAWRPTDGPKTVVK